MNALVPFLRDAAYFLVAGGALALGGLLLSRPARRGPTEVAQAVALAVTACWALAALAFGAADPVTGAALSLAYFGWLWMLYRLFAYDSRDKRVGPIRPVVLSLAFVELLRLVLLALEHGHAGAAESLAAIGWFESTLRLLFCTGALVLVHNLYAGASAQARQALGWPAAGLAVLWLYDLNLATVAYLVGERPLTLVAFRGAAVLVMLVMLALGAMRNDGNLRFSPSRSFAFQSFSLLIIGAYLAIMVLVAQGLAYLGGELARLIQAACIAVAGALALAVLPSPRLRGWLRVTLSKHLFQHRYDYRAEWLRFTDTMGRAGRSAAPLPERVVQALADITDSPHGLLLTPREDGAFELGARWQWDSIVVPAEALSPGGARFLENSQFIVDLDDVRAARAPEMPVDAVPGWLAGQSAAWAMIPLLHYERLVGVVVLARPLVARRFDWEDLDLLRIVGRQLASYLAEQASQDALGEAQRFDEFNRRIAFVMHDIKNLASQLALLARNAEKHSHNPEFRADMLITLRNSADKLQALLARLGRYGDHRGDGPQPVDLSDLLERIAARYAGQHQVVFAGGAACSAMADRESLEQALVHLVQNAIEASGEGRPVLLHLRIDQGLAVVEVADSGSGMNADFVRNRLFKPFHSSKPGGFGIGAFEARELIRGMGGQLDVESREGLGTRFLVSLALARAGDGEPRGEDQRTKVA